MKKKFSISILSLAVSASINAGAGSLYLMNLSGHDLNGARVEINNNPIIYNHKPLKNNGIMLIGNSSVLSETGLNSFKLTLIDKENLYETHLGAETASGSGYSPYFSTSNNSDLMPYAQNDVTLIYTGYGQAINGESLLELTMIGEGQNGGEVADNTVYGVLDDEPIARPAGTYTDFCQETSWDPARGVISGKCDTSSASSSEKISTLNYTSCLDRSLVSVSSDQELFCSNRVSLDSVYFDKPSTQIAHFVNNMDASIRPQKLEFNVSPDVVVDQSDCQINGEKVLTSGESCEIKLTSINGQEPEGNMIMTYTVDDSSPLLMSGLLGEQVNSGNGSGNNTISANISSHKGTEIKSDTQAFQLIEGNPVNIMIQNIGGNVWYSKASKTAYEITNSSGAVVESVKINPVSQNSCLVNDETNISCLIQLEAQAGITPGLYSLVISDMSGSNLNQSLKVTFTVPEKSPSLESWVDESFDSATTTKIILKNGGDTNTSSIDISKLSLSDTSNFELYPGKGNVGWCNETECTNVCSEGQSLESRCNVYVHSRPSVFAGESSPEAQLTINDQVYSISNTPYLYENAIVQQEIDYFGNNMIVDREQVLATSVGGKNTADWHNLKLPHVGYGWDKHPVIQATTTDQKGKFYAATYLDGSFYIGIYNPKSKKWESEIPINMKTMKWPYSIAVGNNNEIYLGVRDQTTRRDQIIKYNSISKQWAVLDETWVDPYQAGFNPIQNHLYYLKHSGSQFASYSPVSNSFSEEDILDRRFYHPLESYGCDNMAQCPKYVEDHDGIFAEKKGNTSSWSLQDMSSGKGLFKKASMVDTAYETLSYNTNNDMLINGQILSIVGTVLVPGTVREYESVVAYSKDNGLTTKVINVPESVSPRKIAVTNLIQVQKN
ncbi:hypothetical protein OAO18_03860 [Francisellaceae bacterium]|nr:hypothetical protein [Francisellaceae bacterium]